MTLDAARARALTLTNAAKAGRDLLAEEKAARIAAEQRLRIGELAELYLSKKVRGHMKTSHEMEGRLKRALAPIKNRFADEVRRRDLRELLDATAERGAVREAQQRRQMVRVLFRWAVSQDLIENDPSAGIASFGASPRRERVLAPEEIRTFWLWLGVIG